MKKTFFLTMAMCCLAFASCNKSKDATLTPDSSAITGDFREYFTVVEKPYIVKYDEENWMSHYVICVELQRTDVPFSFDTEGIEPAGTYGAGVRGNFGIGIDVIDADGNIVLSKKPTDGGLSGVYSSDDLKNLLSLNSGETGIVRWSANEFEKYDNKNFTFKVSSSFKKVMELPSASSATESSSSSSSDWDEILDDYEKFINHYVAVLKKANQGDMNAMSESAELMEEYMEFVEKLDAASDEMTAAQVARYSKITMKVSSLM